MREALEITAMAFVLVTLTLPTVLISFDAMDELETNYQGKRLRYYELGGNDLLLNTNDVCAILEFKPAILNNKFVDLADAASAALQLNETLDCTP